MVTHQYVNYKNENNRQLISDESPVVQVIYMPFSLNVFSTVLFARSDCLL